MEVLKVVKYDGPPSQTPWLAYKFPSDSLVLGSQLIVNKSQEAVFFKGGNALDVFGPGTHTLGTANLPFLNKLVNLPFGRRTPFSAEVYFINKAAKLDMTWGTTDRFPVTEPRYGIIVNVGAFGKFGIKVADARTFTTQIVGALHGNDISDHGLVSRYFKGLVVSKVKTAIADMIVRESISLLDITVLLDRASTTCREKIAGEFDRFGLEVVNFYVESINVPDADLEKVKGVLEVRAEFNLLGDERYTRKRSFDVMESGAANEGAGGAAMSAGLGIGLGFGAGSVAGELGRQMHVSSPIQPASSGCPKCETVNLEGAKFCHQCGTGLAVRKCGCGHENPAGAKFCGNCGKGL